MCEVCGDSLSGGYGEFDDLCESCQNYIAEVMETYGFSYQEAFDYVGEYYE